MRRMDDMDELVAWIREQLDEDERVARAWLPLGNPTTADRNHIARHDPARVLRDIEAKRLILDEHTTNGKALCSRCVERWDYYHDGCEACADEPHEKPVMFVGRPCPTVLALAVIYRDRPGYRSEWAPSDT